MKLVILVTILLYILIGLLVSKATHPTYSRNHAIDLEEIDLPEVMNKGTN